MPDVLLPASPKKEGREGGRVPDFGGSVIDRNGAERSEDYGARGARQLCGGLPHEVGK
jgi:hypothetical protein